MMRPVPFLFSPVTGPVDLFEATSFLYRRLACRALVENAGDVVLHSVEGAGNVILHAIEDAGNVVLRVIEDAGDLDTGEDCF